MPKKPETIIPTDRELLAENSNLTHGQLAIWTAQQQDPTPGRFARILLFDFEGRLDTAAFQRGFRALVETNDALRMVVEEQDGVPQRRLLPAIEGGLSLLDFSADKDPDKTLSDWLGDRCRSGFEAGQPLFHSALIRLGEQRFAWYLRQHQLITDGVSTSLVCRRMADFYGRALQGQLGSLAAYPAFEDYAGFERRHRETAVYNHSRNYWGSKLAKQPPPLQFFGHEIAAAAEGAELAGEAAKQGENYRVRCTLGPERTLKLRELARIPDNFLHSLEMSQYLGFATLLFGLVYRATGDSLLRIGAPFTNRSADQFQETIGLFSEVCPLQLEVAEEDSFQMLLRKLMKEVRTVLMHAQPGVSCAVADHPCQVMFDYITLGCVRFRGLTGRPRWVNSGCAASGTRLRMQVLDFAGCDNITVNFDLDTKAFDEQQQALFGDRFMALLDAYLADGGQLIAEVFMPDGNHITPPLPQTEAEAETDERELA